MTRHMNLRQPQPATLQWPSIAAASSALRPSSTPQGEREARSVVLDLRPPAGGAPNEGLDHASGRRGASS
jgi:hypothetical protein